MWGAEAVGWASCLQGAATAARSLRDQLGARAVLPVAGRGGPTSGRPRSAVAIPVSLRPRGPPEPATMPLGLKPTCSVCKTTSSSMWKKGPQGEILCHHCTGRGGAGGGGAGSGAAGGTGGSSGGGGFGAATFASTSAAPPQSNGGGGGKQVSSSGPFRRRRPTRGEVDEGLAGGEGPGLRDRCATAGQGRHPSFLDERLTGLARSKHLFLVRNCKSKEVRQLKTLQKSPHCNNILGSNQTSHYLTYTNVNRVMLLGFFLVIKAIWSFCYSYYVII